MMMIQLQWKHKPPLSPFYQSTTSEPVQETFHCFRLEWSNKTCLIVQWVPETVTSFAFLSVNPASHLKSTPPPLLLRSAWEPCPCLTDLCATSSERHLCRVIKAVLYFLKSHPSSTAQRDQSHDRLRKVGKRLCLCTLHHKTTKAQFVFHA